MTRSLGESIQRHLQRRLRLARQRSAGSDEVDAEPVTDPAYAAWARCAWAPELRREEAANSAPPRPRVPARPGRPALWSDFGGVNVAGGRRVEASDRAGLEQLCRYLSRPPLSEKRVHLTDDGNVAIALKRPWRGGVTRVVFAPMAFLSRLALLVPPPGRHLRRFYGIFAPRHRWRQALRPPLPDPAQTGTPVAPPRPLRMKWADLLKRIWRIDATQCHACGGRLRCLGAVTDPDVIAAIVAAIQLTEQQRIEHARLTRGPPD